MTVVAGMWDGMAAPAALHVVAAARPAGGELAPALAEALAAARPPVAPADPETLLSAAAAAGAGCSPRHCHQMAPESREWKQVGMDSADCRFSIPRSRICTAELIELLAHSVLLLTVL